MKLFLQDISKSYGTNPALRQVSAELDPGIYALLGPNGSGKSTLMNIITDNLAADHGTISYCGDREGAQPENVRNMGVRFREKLGFMPQYPGMYPNFTVERFLWYMVALKDMGRGLQRKEKKQYIAAQIEDVLKAVELDDVPHRRIGALSGGMKQRLCLAQAVLGDPEILILDEPTSGLDPKQRIAIRNYISRIALNKIVLFATHVVSDVEYIAKNIILLKKGVVVDNAPPHELTAKIEGMVWNVPVCEADVVRMQQQFRVTNISRSEEAGTGGKIILRELAEEQPTPDAKTTAPTLEDYYLRVFGQEASV